MRLGRVTFNISYVVDLDNEDMVNHAKESIWEDLSNGYRYNNTSDYVKIDQSDKDLTESMIPDWIKEEI